jgi:histidinol-phosphatase (PHP family)
MIDCHVHTCRCGHAQGDVAAMLLHSSALEVVTFTEHLPLPAGMDPNGEYSMSSGELEEYAAEVREAALTAPTKVLLGVESDWLDDRVNPEIGTIVDTGVDLVLGSVHFIGDWVFDDPSLLHQWEGRDVEKVWRDYFERVVAAAHSGNFDVMAHTDLVKKFGFRPADSVIASLADEVAAEFRAAGVAFEVSPAKSCIRARHSSRRSHGPGFRPRRARTRTLRLNSGIDWLMLSPR